MKTGLSRAMPLLLLEQLVNPRSTLSSVHSAKAMEIFDGVPPSHWAKFVIHESIEPLIRALADKYENVRAESASSLAAMGKPH